MLNLGAQGQGLELQVHMHRGDDSARLLMEMSQPMATQVTVSRGGVEKQTGNNYSFFLTTWEQNAAQN